MSHATLRRLGVVAASAVLLSGVTAATGSAAFAAGRHVPGHARHMSARTTLAAIWASTRRRTTGTAAPTAGSAGTPSPTATPAGTTAITCGSGHTVATPSAGTPSTATGSSLPPIG